MFGRGYPINEERSMRQYIWTAAILATATATGLVLADGETAPVRESQVRFPVRDQITVGYKSVRLVLTGTAVRKGHGLPLYAIGSYLEEGARAKTAEQLAAADAVKMMHVVLEVPLDGRLMFDGIRTGIRLNHSANEFTSQLGELERALRGHDLPRGQHIFLTYLPKIGLRCQAVGKAEATIAGPAFGKAIWENFLGRKSVSDEVKAGLTSRL
jgi:hypothetical protein